MEKSALTVKVRITYLIYPRKFAVSAKMEPHSISVLENVLKAVIN